MNKKNVEIKKNVESIVIKYFIRVVKNHNLYEIFKKSFDRISSSKEGERNPFGSFEDVYQMEDKIKNFTSRNHMNYKINNEYDVITMTINHLLHYFLESSGINPIELGKYGQEIFDLTCYKIYGDKYINDMEKLDAESNLPKPRTDKEAWVIGNYMSKVKNGEFNGSFEDYKGLISKLNRNNSYDELIGLYDEYNEHDTDEQDLDFSMFFKSL